VKGFGSAILFVSTIILASNVNAQFAFNEASPKQIAMTSLSSMPLAFTENHGQWGEKTLFKAEAGGAIFYFCKDEAVYLFMRNTDELEDIPMETRHPVSDDLNDELNRLRYKKEAMLIRAQFVGANPDPEIIDEGRLSHNCNYFYGNDTDKWRTDVPNYSSITYKDIWPGIDLKYYGNGKGMKYDFIVNPGADISQIRISYEGVDDLSISNAGDLQAQTRFGLVYENIPEIYQEINGNKISVSGKYRLIEPGPYGQAVFGFDVETYNPSLALVIDPELLYSTYLGGSSDEDGYGITVDDQRNIYVTGHTMSTNFPLINPYDSSYNGGDDVFVTKLSPAGDSLIYSTYIGGNLHDYGYTVEVDLYGDAHIAGYTSSSNFPTVNPYDGNLNGYNDIFVTKISPAGNVLLYSTYIGGSDADIAYDLAIGSAFNAYITGWTTSPDFPLFNAYDNSYDTLNYADAFAVKLSMTGNYLLYSTYLGGNREDMGYGIAIDSLGNAYIAGNTAAPDFPTANSYDDSLESWVDGFIAKLSATGNSLLYGTYLGGNGNDYCYDIAVDGIGNISVTGRTRSSDFPLYDPYDEYYGGDDDAYVTKLAAAGNSLLFSTYLGGWTYDIGNKIAVDDIGNIYVAGYTLSSNFPAVNAYDNSYNGAYDAFATKFSASDNTLLFSTFLGGSANDAGMGLALDSFGNALITGYTFSPDFPMIDPYDNSLDGPSDIFIAKLETPTTAIENQIELPVEFELSQNYPNPFNAQTKIEFSIDVRSEVSISIYNLLGRKVATLLEGIENPGRYSVIWEAKDIPSGMYFYRLTANGHQNTKKMVLLK